MEKSKQNQIQICDALIQFLKVVSNKTRLGIISLLVDEEKCVGDIQDLLGAKQSYISQQLQILKKKGYLSSRRDGTQIYYRIKDEKILKVFKMLGEEIC